MNKKIRSFVLISMSTPNQGDHQMNALSLAYTNKIMMENPSSISEGIRQLGRNLFDSEITRLKIKGAWRDVLRAFWKSGDKSTAAVKVIDFINHYAPSGTQWGPDPVNSKNFGFFRELSKKETSERYWAQHNENYWRESAWRLRTFEEGEVQKIIEKLRARSRACNENGMPEQAEGVLYSAQLLSNLIARDIEPEPDYEEIAAENTQIKELLT